jgi:hypothetical protein
MDQSLLGRTVQRSLLTPVIALILWSLVMCAWLYATRLPAMKRARIPLDPRMSAIDLQAQLSAEVRWKAENYNHLMEQPTLFYALAISLALLNAGDAVNIGLAWAYVTLRVIHSLVHATMNIIALRFLVFMPQLWCWPQWRSEEPWLCSEKRVANQALDDHLRPSRCAHTPISLLRFAVQSRNKTIS